MPEISSHRDPSPPSRASQVDPGGREEQEQRVQVDARGGDVESSPSERAAQFEAVPIGEVTVAMPAKTQKPAS